MIDFTKIQFHNPTKGVLNFNGAVEEIFNYMGEKPKNFYEIVVGCDSPSGEKPNFPVALVILRKGNGGRFFLAKINYEHTDRKFYTIRERVLEEIYLSCEVALKFRDAINEKALEQSELFDYEFQYIHADIGGSGSTRDMIKEVVGLIRSNGFIPKIKPESFAASIVADRFS